MSKRRCLAHFGCQVVVLVALAISGCSHTWPFARDDDRPPTIDSVPAALAAIRESRDPGVRTAAFEYLGDPKRYHDAEKREDAVGVLALALEAERDPQIRIGLVRSLARFDSPAATAAILKVLDCDDATVRANACRVLGEIGATSAVQKLSDLLVADSSLDVRLAAAGALGSLGSRDAALALLGGIADRDVALEHRSRESLVKLTGADHGYDLDAWRAAIQATDFDGRGRTRSSLWGF